VRLTDATLRSAQAVLGGCVRVGEMLPIAAKLDGVGLGALDAFGGSTFRACVDLGEDPWERLQRLREVTPRTANQALLRGQSLTGRQAFADDVVELFIATAAGRGVDVFRLHDPLNDLRNLEVALRAVRAAGKRSQGSLCYAISPVHDLDHWRSLARGLAELGADELVVLDAAGLLSPRACAELVRALREAVELPVAVHARGAGGMGAMASMAAVEAGATRLDTALSPLASGVSPPAAESVVAALAGGEHDTGLDLDALGEIKVELEALISRHHERAHASAGRVDSDVLRYRMPLSMLQDLRLQLDGHNALGRWRDVVEEVPRVRQELGWPPLVGPVIDMIAAQAVYNVLGGERYATVSQELKDYLQGLYGRPPVPADPEVRRLVLGQEDPLTVRPADLLEPGIEMARSELRGLGFEGSDEQVLTHLMCPGQAPTLFRALAAAASTETLSERPLEVPAAPVEAEPAADGAVADDVAAATAQAMSAEFDVEVEGEVFRVRVAGAGTVVVPMPAQAGARAGSAGGGPPARPRAGAITAPMQGLIVKVPVKVGDDVALGDVVAVLEAMKMQNDIVATKPGKVLEVYVQEGDVVTPNQALVAIG
jgi:pyruvate carboxylase subunit B